uniref:Triosephosphate isomerase n=1 Tax=Eucampia antarctica TaxID=49252 RepID=A0A7S2R507_9STRA|mmetsp:Transcript_17036/g.16460  ORF Transcript_17036/g.16460 Transcript_17036/m.16460 type:complete len:297 (+) Transcript_17036:76-966(+)|eukprot:CAMPEP_0197826802 /NCGR_PEP_ID=MMETSP1437-20131217/3699_1 /TAXON_ID=49252 ORGANISM="Eucampia antarctica, Strain CCMP1452" /NCGR_SAMPLE_ID=MMETSP1437 /ASSEMBLY_ACC=CAM_ASM_001096 /LENGTH=296 /DNA_ID=CAMNT_0043427389 /DNA_START=61 /DNA_END=951 /DNA_ORIENTATION=-
MKFSLTLLSTISCASAFSVLKGSKAPSSSQLLMAGRQPIMAGNWKMNPATEDEATALAKGLTTLMGDETCPMDEENDSCTEVVIFPPHPFLSNVKSVVEEAGITTGSQSVFFEDKGAYTGSVSISMVKSVGCEYVLCGHSERRTLFNDDDDAINRKVLKVLESGLKPILCIGETKEEYDLNIKNEVCAMQLAKDLVGVTKERMEDVVIAYEPVWAIGTGLVCESKDANAVHGYLRTVLAGLYDDEVAQATRIQYGGSVTPDSVDELMSQPEIDGCLVGGASLDAEKFGRIINFVKV